MAPKIRYDAAVVQTKADEAAEKEIQTLAREGVELPASAEVSCEYLGVLNDEAFTLERTPALRSTVGYKWSYRDNTVDVTQTKRSRYDYAVEHGSTLPEQWKTALKCRRLPRVARESADLFAEQSGLRDVTCRMVGVPRPVTIHTDGRIELGSILKLAMGIAPVEHVLCAHIRDQSWFCHRGSLDGYALSATPFAEKDLVVKDVGADLWVDGLERPRKRVRTHLRMGKLAEEIRKHSEAFDHAVVRAHWKAEEIRAGSGLMHEAAALVGYDPNPFNWTRGSRAEIVFLWTRMDNLLSTISDAQRFRIYRVPSATRARGGN